MMLDDPQRNPYLSALRCGCSSVVECQLPKLEIRVRFPSPAPSCHFFIFFPLRLNLIVNLSIIGTFDLLSDANERDKALQPMTDTGILVTILAYCGLLAILLWLSVLMADSGIPGTNLPLIFISS